MRGPQLGWHGRGKGRERIAVNDNCHREEPGRNDPI